MMNCYYLGSLFRIHTSPQLEGLEHLPALSASKADLSSVFRASYSTCHVLVYK